MTDFAEMLWPFAALPATTVALDLETTGLPDKDGLPSIISVGVAQFHRSEGFIDGEEFRVRPQRQIHPQAQKIHGISQEQAEQYPSFTEQWPRIQHWLAGRLILCHNAAFDWPILLDHCRRYQVEPEPDVAGVFCSQRSAQAWAATIGMPCSERGPGLDRLTHYLGVENLREEKDGLHGAFIDAKQLGLVVAALQNLVPARKDYE